MVDGVIRFISPEKCDIRKFIREMQPKQFTPGRNLIGVEAEITGLER
jgi:CRISPR-associated protein Cas5d